MANFATLESLKKGDEDKEKKAGNAYYAGGARGAGQGGRSVVTAPVEAEATFVAGGVVEVVGVVAMHFCCAFVVGRSRPVTFLNQSYFQDILLK